MKRIVMVLLLGALAACSSNPTGPTGIETGKPVKSTYVLATD